MWQCEIPKCGCAEYRSRWLEGDRDAGGKLVDQLTPLVRGIVRSRLGPSFREHWNDAEQAVYLRMLGRMHSWKGHAPFCHWLGRLAAYRAIDYRQELASDSTGRLPADEMANPKERLSPTQRACLREAIEGLPPNLRQLYEMTIDGRSREEAAQATGMALRTVQYQLTEIRRRLAECMER